MLEMYLALVVTCVLSCFNAITVIRYGSFKKWIASKLTMLQLVMLTMLAGLCIQIPGQKVDSDFLEYIRSTQEVEVIWADPASKDVHAIIMFEDGDLRFVSFGDLPPDVRGRLYEAMQQAEEQGGAVKMMFGEKAIISRGESMRYVAPPRGEPKS